MEGLVIEHLEQNSLRPVFHCNKLLEFVQFLLGVEDSGHLRNFYKLPPQRQFLFDCWMATSNRLGDLQISKIKRRANLNLSLSELLNSKWDLGFFSESLSLGMLRIFSGAANRNWRAGAGYL